MQRIKLIRISRTINETFGTILGADGVPICQTLELPWKDNARNISCIPQGVYRCKKTHSKALGDVITINDVENRSGILIHSGNTHKDIEGCILVGRECGYLYKNNAVLNSKKPWKNY